MGIAQDYPKTTSSHLSNYVAIGPARIVNGVRGRIVKRRDDSDTHTNLPFYANRSDMYLRQNPHGVCQARVYINHVVKLDFDWSHAHRNKGDRQVFEKGVIHVQEWTRRSDGTFYRLSDNARLMNGYEVEKYGPILRAFCPTVKFR